MKRAADFRGIARGCLSGHWASAVGTTLLAGLLGANITMTGSGASTVTNIYNSVSDEDGGVVTISQNIPTVFLMTLAAILLVSVFVLMVVAVVQFIIGSFVSLGLATYNLNLIDGKEARVGQIFCHTSIMGKAIWLRLRMSIFTFLWSLLLVIPGIIKSYSYSMAGFIMSENPEMSAKEAMEVSMRMMKGNKWRLFCLQLSFIGWGILCVFTFGIGYLWLNPYMNAATAAFYDEISRNEAVGEGY